MPSSLAFALLFALKKVDEAVSKRRIFNMTKNTTNTRFMTLEEALMNLGFENCELDDLRHEELFALYHYYYEYLEKMNNELQNPQVYQNCLSTMERIIDELTDRIAMYEDWSTIKENNDLSTWNRIAEIAIESLNKSNSCFK